jgi:outer membrane protein assembly factor BamB
MVFAMSGYHGAAIGVKIPAGASGDITTRRIWTSQKKPPQRIGSGIAVNRHIYILNEPGIATCIRMDNGKEVWKERVGKGNSWGSMSLVANRIYVTNTLGQTLVLAPSPKFKLLATNPLGEMTRGSPAFSDGKVFIRTYKHLWCIGE